MGDPPAKRERPPPTKSHVCGNILGQQRDLWEGVRDSQEAVRTQIEEEPPRHVVVAAGEGTGLQFEGSDLVEDLVHASQDFCAGISGVQGQGISE